MNTDRRTILSLIALGRITPREAERLLLVANEEHEMRWIAASCFALAIATQVHLYASMLASPRSLADGVILVMHWLGVAL